MTLLQAMVTIVKSYLNTEVSHLVVLTRMRGEEMPLEHIFNGFKRRFMNRLRMNVPAIEWAYLAPMEEVEAVTGRRKDKRTLIDFACTIVNQLVFSIFLTEQILCKGTQPYLCERLLGTYVELTLNKHASDYGGLLGWDTGLKIRSTYDLWGDNFEVEVKTNAAFKNTSKTKITAIPREILKVIEVSENMTDAEIKAWNQKYGTPGEDRDKLLAAVDEIERKMDAERASGKTCKKIMYILWKGFGYIEDVSRPLEYDENFISRNARVCILIVPFSKIVGSRLIRSSWGDICFETVLVEEDFPNGAYFDVKDAAEINRSVKALIREDVIESELREMFDEDILNLDYNERNLWRERGELEE